MGRRRETNQLSQEAKQEKRKAILAALTRASDIQPFREGVADIPVLEADDYYTLSPQELAALVNGDMEKLEVWVNNMDKDQAARLLRWLIREKW